MTTKVDGDWLPPFAAALDRITPGVTVDADMETCMKLDDGMWITTSGFYMTSAQVADQHGPYDIPASNPAAEILDWALPAEVDKFVDEYDEDNDE
ncbi:hypothetical protein J4T99_gp042 [Mycobacterium phage Bromden]|uniref:Uncharacterized protein n=1 Tax=Mycobacterium phage Bromden TaxID=2283252 RepID=A0A345MBH7_9CAUD|nr:hypothetical protein J4T99_gp042 [Mycobacterium phage Bromden]AXH67848.1 hypothetical protein SEA_BROMDEN_42 [Mycobacterium phage Bromden]